MQTQKHKHKIRKGSQEKFYSPVYLTKTMKKYKQKEQKPMKKETVSNVDINEILMRISHFLPARQNDIWKKMGIDSKKCSRMMKTLEDANVIKRTKVERGTYMIEKINVNKNKPVIQMKFSALLSDSGKFSPCVGCEDECKPETCRPINNWLLGTDKQ